MVDCIACSARHPVGRPRKHEGGWTSANKRICIANETFTKWRRLRDELQLGNDDAVACYLWEAEVHSRNERLEPRLGQKMLVDSIGLWLCYRMSMLLAIQKNSSHHHQSYHQHLLFLQVRKACLEMFTPLL